MKQKEIENYSSKVKNAQNKYHPNKHNSRNLY